MVVVSHPILIEDLATDGGSKINFIDKEFNIINRVLFHLPLVPIVAGIGYEFLKRYFVRNVVEPIKYHVKAKKYLTRDVKYYQALSEASKVSLKLQGGIMNDKESRKFENNEFFESSIKLRKFDESAKKTELKIKSINEYKNLLVSKLI